MKKRFITGDLRESIQITQLTNSDDGAGGVISVETVYWDTYAKVTPLSSSNMLEANQQSLKDGFEFIVRYRSDKFIKPDMRIKWKGSYLALISVPVDYVFKEWTMFKATWLDRPQESEATGEGLIYYGTAAANDALTMEQILEGSSVEYDAIVGIIVPFINPSYVFNWFWLPDAIGVPTWYTNIEEPADNGALGTVDGLFAPAVQVGEGVLFMGNYEVPMDGGFLFSTQ